MGLEIRTSPTGRWDMSRPRGMILTGMTAGLASRTTRSVHPRPIVPV
ncbi:hypothetical protein HMPREF9567_00421 [Cutibacterium acnes HL013PA1]|nr:hypothetical protein HMPREF9567_00421 [Cutibacterium acnes HL013PA1]